MLEGEKLRSYPKVWGMGHRYIADLFKGPVVVQEKIDGSQFSFGVQGGGLHVRSKGAVIDWTEPPSGLFGPSVTTVVKAYNEGRLPDGWIFRGEAMCKPKHNVLAYDRIPLGNIMLFDVDTGLEDRVEDQVFLQHQADLLGIECVQVFKQGTIGGFEELQDLLQGPSQLGGMREGIVVKNYDRFSDMDGKMLMGKLVASKFKEIHANEWGEAAQAKKDIIGKIVAALGTEARWHKAVQALEAFGTLEGDPRDIGALIKEVRNDVLIEVEDEIKQKLFDHFQKDILSGITRGLPEWYKQQLLEGQHFEEVTE